MVNISRNRKYFAKLLKHLLNNKVFITFGSEYDENIFDENQIII